MKKLLLLTIALGLSISAPHAEEYKAPKLDFGNKLSKDWKNKDPKKADWENNYKVQDSAEAERNVASDEETNEKNISRDPSSQPLDENKVGSGVESWPYQPEEEEDR